MNLMKTDNIDTIAFLVTTFPPEVSGASHFNWKRAQWFAKQGKYREIVFATDWQNVSDSHVERTEFNRHLQKTQFLHGGIRVLA